jgi:hypothetical protein
VNAQGDATLEATVAEVKPLAGNGPYLAVVSGGKEGEERRTLIYRSFDSEEGTAGGVEQTISFLFRLDSDVETLSRLDFYDSTDAKAGSNDTSSWQIRSATLKEVPQWGVVGRDGKISWSGVQIVAGDVYKVIVRKFPAEERCEVEIVNMDHEASQHEGKAQFVSSWSDYLGASVKEGVARSLSFRAVPAEGTTDKPVELRWSLDEVSVVAGEAKP